MKLGIISDSHHYRDENQRLYNLSVLVDQFSCLVDLFDKAVICAPLIPGPPPATHKPYNLENIELLPVPNAGGNTLSAKLELLGKSLAWWRQLNRLFKQVDAVHIRCPNNISILGLVKLSRRIRFAHAVYTGTWMGYAGEPVTYKFQRLFLKYFFRGPVFVYGDWPNQPAHIVPNFSPTYNEKDWISETETVRKRLERLRGPGISNGPVRLLTVGALTAYKNQQLVIQILNILKHKGIEAHLVILGDGNLRSKLMDQVEELGLANYVRFEGAVSHDRVRAYYRESDFVVQAPLTEGYGKVPVEALFHGAIPVLSDVNLSRQLLGDSFRGRVFSPGNPEMAADLIIELLRQPEEMNAVITNGRTYARALTLEAWKQNVSHVLQTFWNIKLAHGS